MPPANPTDAGSPYVIERHRPHISGQVVLPDICTIHPHTRLSNIFDPPRHRAFVLSARADVGEDSAGEAGEGQGLAPDGAEVEKGTSLILEGGRRGW